MKNKKKLKGIYIHIPFCVQKCKYCDFLSLSQYDKENEYINCLISEIKTLSIQNSKDKITSIFIGGGTPSSIKTENIVKIFDNIYENYNVDSNAEISIEVNPGSVDENSIKIYRQLGINRISMGVQSLNNIELLALGRIHKENDVYKSVDIISKHFDNFNLDIMIGIPLQTMKSLEYTLENIKKLNSTHISAYDLIIEEKTPFFRMYNQGKLRIPSDDLTYEMSEYTMNFLENIGYNRYEISNYSKRGFECRHNILYWERDEYLAFGASAAGFLLPNISFENPKNLKKYLKIWSEINNILEYNEKIKYLNRNIDIYELTKEELMSEMMFMGLRMIKGVDKNKFYDRFFVNLNEYYEKEISELKKEGFMLENDRYVYLTKKGLTYGNYCFSKFL